MQLKTTGICGFNAKIVMDEIANELSSANWYSTQTTAYAIIAVAKFVSGSGSDNMGIQFEQTISGAKMVSN